MSTFVPENGQWIRLVAGTPSLQGTFPSLTADHV